MSEKTKSSSGIGFLGLLTILFITLKLINVINWSWWWILSPMLIPLGIAVLVIMVIIVVVFIRDKSK